MFNIGFPEFAVIFIVALLLLGPQKLPEFARWVGKALREIRQATHEVRTAIDLELEREEFERLQQEFQDAVDPTLDALREEGESTYASLMDDLAAERDMLHEDPIPSDEAELGKVSYASPSDAPSDPSPSDDGLAAAGEDDDDGFEDFSPAPSPLEGSPFQSHLHSDDLDLPPAQEFRMPDITGPPPGTISQSDDILEDDPQDPPGPSDDDALS